MGNNMGKHALVVGATGATGKDLVQKLLNDANFSQVSIFVRRHPGLQHVKLLVHVIDFDHPEQWKNLVKGDVLFSCLGTTLKAAGSKQAQWRIDYDYQYNFAVAAKENGVLTYVLVSSGYSSAGSPVFYSRMKGQLEEAVKKLAFPRLIIFNPPILVRKNSDRAGEITGIKLIAFLNRFGLLRSQRPLPTDVLAQAMINAAKEPFSGTRTYNAAAIWQIAQ